MSPWLGEERDRAGLLSMCCPGLTLGVPLAQPLWSPELWLSPSAIPASGWCCCPSHQSCFEEWVTVDFLPLLELSWVFSPFIWVSFVLSSPLLVEEALEGEDMQGHEDSWSNSTCSSIPATFECQVRDAGRRGLSLLSGKLGKEAGAESLVAPCHCSS